MFGVLKAWGPEISKSSDVRLDRFHRSGLHATCNMAIQVFNPTDQLPTQVFLPYDSSGNENSLYCHPCHGASNNVADMVSQTPNNSKRIIEALNYAESNKIIVQ